MQETHFSLARARAALALTALAALAACAASDGARASEPVTPHDAAPVVVESTDAARPEVEAIDVSDAPKAWTDAFGQKAVVVAEHVRIEGPDGLLDHVVVSSDDAFYERSVTHDGAKLTQVTMRLGEDVPIIRAQLDQWQFAAFRQVTVVERMEAGDVTVSAHGDASLRDPLGKEERGETLRWVGTIPR
jgi:hypothetical protein